MKRILTEAGDLLSSSATKSTRRRKHQHYRRHILSSLLWIVPCAATIGLLISLLLVGTAIRDHRRDYRTLRGRSHLATILSSHHDQASTIASSIAIRRNLRTGRLLLPLKPSCTSKEPSFMLGDETRDLESVLPDGYEYNNPYNDQRNDREGKKMMTTVAIVSAILVSIAGTIIFCASLVYLIELYERLFPDSHKAWIERCHRQRRHRVDKNQSSYGQNLGPTPDQTSSEEEQVILHHETDGDAIFTILRDEDAPLSCVSSVTNSLAGYETETEEEELDLSTVVGALEQIVEVESGCVPSNDDEDDWCIQVNSSGEYDSVLYKEKEWTVSFGIETDHKKDSHKPMSLPTYEETLESKATSGSEESSCSLSYISDEVHSDDIAEKCDVCQTSKVGIDPSNKKEDFCASDDQKQRAVSSPLRPQENRSPDDDEEERDVAVPSREEELDGSRMHDQTEHSNHESMTGPPSFEIQDYIRDIYFIPNAGAATENERSTSDQVLGLRLSDAMDSESYPCIAALLKNSPLTGRVFEGDYIVAMNDKDTGGMSAATILSMAHSCCEHVGNATVSTMIKLTVMSSQADDNDDDDTSSMYSFEDIACCSAESTVDVHQEKELKGGNHTSHPTTAMEV